MSDTPRILFSGYFGAGNLGDEAILAAEIAAFRTALGADTAIVVASHDHDSTVAFHGEIETVPCWDVSALAAAIRASDLVVWGGGGLLQDHWYVPFEDVLSNSTSGGVPGYLRVPLVAAAAGVPCVMYGQGVGPLARDESRRAVAFAVNALSGMTVRDVASIDLLRACGVQAPVLLGADPAVTLEPAGRDRSREILAAAGVDPNAGPILAVVPRVPPDENRDWIEALVAGVRRFLDSNGGTVIVIAFDHSSHGDEALCKELAQALGPAAVALTSWLPPADVAAVFAASDVVLATRLHGLILAATAATPAIGLAYDPKVTAFAAEMGGAMPVLALAGLDGVVLAHALDDAVRNGAARRVRIQQAVAGLRVREAINLETALTALRGRFAAPGAARPELAWVAAQGRVWRLERELAAANQACVGMAGEVTTAVAERKDALQALEGAARLRDQAEADRERFATERDEARRRLTGVEAHRDALAGERQVLASQLEALHSSRVVRLILRYWHWAAAKPNRGSGLRRLVRGAHRLLQWRSAVAVPRVSTVATEATPDLAAFERAMRERGARSVVVMLCATKLIESEGQRPMQLALALARRGVAVVFAYWRWSTSEWCDQDRGADGIFQIPVDLLAARPDDVLVTFSGWSDRLVLFTFPHPSFMLPLAVANGGGWLTIYDVLDDWAEFHRVGQALWYDEGFERHLIHAADAVVAINSHLAARVRRLGGGEVEVVPNGVRPGIEKITKAIPLARGTVTVGYFGYLAGAWFDWDLMLGAAQIRPEWRFYLIGYGGAPEGREVPANLVLLGRQPQDSLAGYAANWDVAVVPFKPEELAAGADPIKVYEYLAMGLPVVVTGVFPPEGAEAFIRRATSLDEFLVALAAAAGERDNGAAERRGYAAGCHWDRRLDAMLDIVTARRQGMGEKMALFVDQS